VRPRRPTITSGPGYPSELVDDVLAWSATPRGGRALEVGPGTGKATVLFAARGLEIVCLELSVEMPNDARRNFAPYAAVKVIDATFEDGRSSIRALISCSRPGLVLGKRRRRIC